MFCPVSQPCCIPFRFASAVLSAGRVSRAGAARLQCGARRARWHRLFQKFLVCLFALVGVVALFPADALAWGPGVHIAAANWLLSNTAALSPLAAHLISSHREAFLYGSLSADIFIGKGCAVRPGHSHNWETGLRLWDATRGKRLKAFALGYLSHLAADIVAHNNYVPAMLSAAPGAGKFSHVYIEAQADRMVRWDTRVAVELFGTKRTREADASLRRATHAERMSFSFKKQMFKSGVALAGGSPWRASLSLCGHLTPSAQDPVYLNDMFDASLRAIVNVLNDPATSPLLVLDPIGETPLRDAKALCQGRAPLDFRHPFPLRFPLHPLVAALPELACGQDRVSEARSCSTNSVFVKTA